MDLFKLLRYVFYSGIAFGVANIYSLLLWFVLGEREDLCIQYILMGLLLNVMTLWIFWWRGWWRK